MRNFLKYTIIMNIMCLYVDINSAPELEALPNKNIERLESLLHNNGTYAGEQYKKIISGLIVNEGFNPNTSKYNPLVTAVSDLDVEFVEFLLRYGADPYFKSSTGSADGRLQMVLKHLNYQINNNNAADRLRNDFIKAKKIEGYFKRYELILQHLLYDAIKANNKDIVKALVQTHPNLLQLVVNNYTPIAWAFVMHQKGMVQLLRELAQKFNIYVESLSTPLIAAVQDNDKYTVQLMLIAGNNPNEYDKYGLAALDYAEMLEDTVLINLLKQYGARHVAVSAPAA